MYQPYQHRRPRQMGSYFLPFFSLIILGLIVVLVFQIIDYFQGKRLAALENKAAVKIVAGNAQLKIWGVDQWAAAFDGSLISEGDIVRTGEGSRVILTLLNGSTVRLDANTEVELAGLKTRDSHDDAIFSLKSGQLWLKRTEKQIARVQMKVLTKHLEITSFGTVFNVVQKETKEMVNVLEGKIRVDVKVTDTDGSSPRTAESLEVALGQELSLTPADVANLQNRRPIEMLALLSDDFRVSEWYQWNRNADLGGEKVVTVADAVNQKENNEVEPQPIELPAASDVPIVLAAPEILAPKEADRTTKVGNVLISGKVSSATQKIEVTTYISGKAEAYVLQKYVAGSETWSYVASREYGNLVPGSNKFSFVAIDNSGKRSDPAEITVVFDRPIEPAEMTAPVLTAFNGSISSETTEDSVKIEGTIGKGIQKMFVNDFVLTQYVPDSKVWVYFAKTSYKNLIVGENKFEVYGVDLDGNKTPITKFTITKKEKPASDITPKQPAATPPVNPPTPPMDENVPL